MAASDAVPTPAPMMPDPKALAEIADRLCKAEHPMLLAEYAGRRPGGFENIVALAELTGSAVWDVNNALNPIMAAAYLLEQNAGNPDAVKDYAIRISKAAETGAATAARVGRFIRQEPLQGIREELVDLSTVCDEVVAMTRPLWAERARGGQIQLKRQFAQGVRRLSRIHTRSVEEIIDVESDEMFKWPWLYGVEVGHWYLTDRRLSREPINRMAWLLFAAVVLEMAMRGLGHIKYLTDIALPNIGVITNIGPQHIGLLGSLDNIARAKSELLRALPADGMAVLPADDRYLDFLRSSTRCRIVTFGTRAADYQVKNARASGLGHIVFSLVTSSGQEIDDIKIPVGGRFNADGGRQHHRCAGSAQRRSQRRDRPCRQRQRLSLRDADRWAGTSVPAHRRVRGRTPRRGERR